MKCNITELRNEIEIKLENETRKLKDLKEYAERSRNISNNVTRITSVMNERFANLENTFDPIYKKCKKHKDEQNLYERTLAVLENYDVAQEVLDIVREGLDGEGLRLNKFLEAMQRLQKAYNYFDKHNPQSDQHAAVSSLLSDGSDVLNNHFRMLLLQNSRPVSPNTLFNSITSDETLSDDAPTSSLSLLHGDLAVIADCLATNQPLSEFVRVYIDIRTVVLMISYDKVKKQQPLCEDGSVHGVESSNGFVQVLEFQKDIVDKREIQCYLTRVLALQRLMKNELALVRRIIPSQTQRRHEAFQCIISKALNSTIEDGLNITARAEKSINCLGFSVMSILLPLIRGLMSMQPEFDQIVEGCIDSVKFQFTKLHNNLCTAVGKVLDHDFTENVKSDPSLGSPKDVAVHETTVEVLTYLEYLTEYEDIIADILGEDSPLFSLSIQIPNNRSVDKNKALLGIYIGKVLCKLNQLLLLKSDFYMDIGVRALFRLINFQHILKVLLRSPLLELVNITQPGEYLQMYFNIIATNKKSYKQCWNKALSYLIGNGNANMLSEKMQDKERYAIKDKFCGFNEEVEQVFGTQSECSVLDVNLREALKRDNKEHVMPMYNTFYKTLSKLNWTKSRRKYMKYTPKELADMLDQFFNIAETVV